MGHDQGPQYKLPITPIALKELLIACDIPQGRLGEWAGLSRTSINLMLNRNYMPPTVPGFKEKIERGIVSDAGAMKWLSERGMQLADIWRVVKDRKYYAHPYHQQKKGPAMIPGDPGKIEEVDEMRKFKIPHETLKYFRLFKNPFADDPRSEKEVFRSDDHRYLEYAMEDAALNAGLLAVIAEVGAGKTVMRREVFEKLRADERVRVVFPLIIDKSRISASSLCDAIAEDLAPGETKKRTPEAKARQVAALLKARNAQGKKVCLIIEEAHLLTMSALKHLKVFHELEDGRAKLLSIILLGQIELADVLDEERYPEVRELSRRIQIATIPGLGDNTYAYLEHRLKLVGGSIENVITREAVTALQARLTTTTPSGQKTSLAYPLTVHNYMSKAMIMAHEMGEAVVSVDIVNAL